MSAADRIETGLESALALLAEQAARLERIAGEERQAIAQLDAARLIELAEEREQAMRAMQAGEAHCRDLMARAGLEADAPLGLLIDRLEAPAAQHLRAMKDGLRTRMAALESTHAENHLRLRAAFDVTAGLLRHLGLETAAQTYGPGGAR